MTTPRITILTPHGSKLDTNQLMRLDSIYEINIDETRKSHDILIFTSSYDSTTFALATLEGTSLSISILIYFGLIFHIILIDRLYPPTSYLIIQLQVILEKGIHNYMKSEKYNKSYIQNFTL